MTNGISERGSSNAYPDFYRSGSRIATSESFPFGMLLRRSDRRVKTLLASDMPVIDTHVPMPGGEAPTDSTLFNQSGKPAP